MRKIKPEQKPERRTLQTCYVCLGKIHGNPVGIGKDTYRHQRCEPGGARWMGSTRAAVSEITQYFGVEVTP